MDTQPAVLLFRGGRGWVNRAIRWQTRSEFTHAALLLSDGETCIEAMQFAGVRHRTLTDDDWQRIVVCDVWSRHGDPIFEQQWNDALMFAAAEVGKGYDYLSIARFLTRRRSPSPNRWFCSELVFESLAFAGVRLLERVEAWKVSPAMLALSPLLIERKTSR